MGWLACMTLTTALVSAAPGAIRNTAPLANGVPFAAAQSRQRLIVAVSARPAPRLPIGRIDPRARVPDVVAADLAEDLGRRLHLPVEMVPLSQDAARHALREGTVDIALEHLPYEPDSAIGYVSASYGSGRGAALVLRNGDIKRWGDLRGKRVCMVEASVYARQIISDEGALSITYPSPVEASAAFEQGDCAALVDDETTLAALLKLPAWRYYTALRGELSPAPAFIAIAGFDAATLTWLGATVRAWQRDGLIERSNRKVADLVSFDVAIAQTDINCH